MIKSLSRRSAVTTLTLGALALAACGRHGDSRSVEALKQEFGPPATEKEIFEFVSGNTFEVRHAPFGGRGRLAGGTHYSDDHTRGRRLQGFRYAYAGGLVLFWQGAWAVDEENGTGLLVSDYTTYKPNPAWGRCVDVFNLGVCAMITRHIVRLERSRAVLFIRSDETAVIKLINGSQPSDVAEMKRLHGYPSLKDIEDAKLYYAIP